MGSHSSALKSFVDEDEYKDSVIEEIVRIVRKELGKHKSDIPDMDTVVGEHEAISILKLKDGLGTITLTWIPDKSGGKKYTERKVRIVENNILT